MVITTYSMYIYIISSGETVMEIRCQTEAVSLKRRDEQELSVQLA